MEERGTLQETADWLDTQLATFISLIGELGALFSRGLGGDPAGEPAQPARPTSRRSPQRAFGFVQRVGDFAATVIVKILELIKDALLGWLSEHAHSIPGFHLLTVILGQNPFTGEEVPRTAENLIKGFITLLPDGEATYEQLAESGVIGAAAERIESDDGPPRHLAGADHRALPRDLGHALARRPARPDRGVRARPRAVRRAAVAARSSSSAW